MFWTWIHHTARPTSKPGLTLKEHATGTLIADGFEQTITEAVHLMKISGYIDFSNMEVGDEVVIRQYMRVKEDGPYKKYGEQIYVDVQDPPLLYITTKKSGKKVYYRFDDNTLAEANQSRIINVQFELIAIVETIVAKEFPMLYYAATPKELRSKVSGATITHVAKDYPEALLKSGKAKELRSKWA